MPEAPSICVGKVGLPHTLCIVYFPGLRGQNPCRAIWPFGLRFLRLSSRSSLRVVFACRLDSRAFRGISHARVRFYGLWLLIGALGSFPGLLGQNRSRASVQSRARFGWPSGCSSLRLVFTVPTRAKANSCLSRARVRFSGL